MVYCISLLNKYTG